MRKLFAVLAVTALAGALAAPLASAGSSPKPVGIQLKDNFFSPKSKSVKTKTKVTWTWKGAEDHNVTLATAPKGVTKSKFSSKTQSKGTFTRTLTTTGNYLFVCTLHAGMELKLKVSK